MFWLVFGPAIASAAISLTADALIADRGVRSRAVLLSALVLALGGAAGIWTGWTLAPEAALASFMAGGAYSVIPGVAFLLAAAAVAVGSSGPRGAQNAGLIAFAVASGALAAASGDLVSLIICVEGAAICSYALVHSARTPRSAEVSMKYFVQGSVATGIFVLGMAVQVAVFSRNGTLTGLMAGIGARPDLSLSAAFGALAIVCALAFKVGAAPMHSWAPDAYETAPSPAAAALAGPGKFAMVGALAVVVANFAAAGLSSTDLGVITREVLVGVGILALASIVVGSTVALTTRSVRRMLGYAGVAQAGYALTALVAVSPSAALFFTATYAVATTAAFLAVAAVELSEPEWDGSVDGLSGLVGRMPGAAFALCVALISLAGIPPLLGFWGKFQAFGAAINGALLFLARGEREIGIALAFLAAVGIVGSVISLGYYGRVVRGVLGGDKADNASDAAPEESAEVDVHSDDGGDAVVADAPAGRRAALVCMALSVLILVAGLLPVVMGPSTLTRGFGF